MTPALFFPMTDATMRLLRSICRRASLSRAVTAFATFALAALALFAAPRSASAQGCETATNDCFTANLFGPGCSNTSCCELVCSIEPSCCAVAWDDVCVALAGKFCSECGGVDESCFTPHPGSSCNNGVVCEAVCAILPNCCQTGWDQSCVDLAIFLTNECGKPATGSCLVPHENPNCRDVTCCERVCSVDPRCCETTWDATCVEFAERFCFTCGNPQAGSCCHTHDGPYCDDRACCEAVCLIDPFCCDQQWDRPCADLATAPDSVCNLPKCRCGNNTPIPGQNLSCRAVHITPGCNDFACCDEVCSIDPFCCAVSWDFTCVQGAVAECALTPIPEINAVCAAATGSCFSENNGLGCSDDACCGTICAFDPTCCEVKWDEDCAARARTVCNDCGSISAGSCFFPHATPSCVDSACCESVCDIDPFCCIGEWDLFCVLNAGTVCLDGIGCGDPRTRPCALPSFLPACEDVECCTLVCNVDPTCCSRAWDETCAMTSISRCSLNTPNCPAPGNALEVHGTPGCANEACCEAVCAVNPICCTFGWNESCVDTAKAVCVTFGTCPGSGDCGASHPTPGCGDSTCCNIVCAADPLCCDVAWSSSCASAARSFCVPESNWNCPCVGSCFESHPETAGCNDEVCCAGVCSIDPSCCTESWDQGCVTIARAVCCGNVGCGDSCSGECFVARTTPYCNDPSCCEAVCRFDPFCCDTRWDASCVQEARRTCTGGSGLLVAGNCFSVHPGTRGCRDAACSEAVCAVNPVCCESGWVEACAELAQKLCADILPSCGQEGAPGCNIAHPSPGCGDAACCEAICKLPDFAYCCEIEWDQFCVQQILVTKGCERYQPGCGDECAGLCCEPKDTPWCSDQTCCETVCNLDSFCCTVRWDAACADLAKGEVLCNTACPDPECGTPRAGSCCFPHGNANCDDLDCCEAVCKIDDFCCTIEWDATCAAIASSSLLDDECKACQPPELFCGAPEAGDCCTERTEPYCNNAKCCTSVCALDALCCEAAWDAICVKLAEAFCPACGAP